MKIPEFLKSKATRNKISLGCIILSILLAFGAVALSESSAAFALPLIYLMEAVAFLAWAIIIVFFIINMTLKFRAWREKKRSGLN